MFLVSTHSRLKAAGKTSGESMSESSVSTHSRLKAAGKPDDLTWAQIKVSTHSRLKAAGSWSSHWAWKLKSFNTQPPEGGWVVTTTIKHGINVSTHSRLKAAGRKVDLGVGGYWFQHTAA